MATSCLSRFQRATIHSIPGSKTSVRTFSSSSHSFYSKNKNGLSSSTTSGTDARSKKKTEDGSFTPPLNSVLAYVGPYSASLRQFKTVAFVFGACGCIAVPSTLYLGNPEHVLAAMAGVASISPSILLHLLTRNEVTKIHVQGSISKKAATPTVTVSTKNPLKLTFEKLNWRGVPKPSQVMSTDLFVQSESDKSITWTTASAITPVTTGLQSSTKPGSKQSSSSTSVPRKEIYRVNKHMMQSNPSFSFILDLIAHQSRLSHGSKGN